MKFRLTTIAYVFALLAAGMAVFGGGVGIVVAAVVLVFWAWLHAEPTVNAVGCIVGIALMLTMFALLLPAVQSAREAARRSSCMGQMKQMALALMNHLDANGSLPPEATYNSDGDPLHSWRAAILPYMEQQALFSKLAHDQPWNSAANAGWTVATQLDQYQCPAHYGSPSTGHYFAIVGEQTAWPKGRGRKLAEVKDDHAFTLLVVEAPLKQSSWAEPVEFTFAEAVDYLSRAPQAEMGAHQVNHGFFHKPGWAVNAAFLDGHVRSLHLPLSRELAKALLTVDGGEKIDDSMFDDARSAELDYAKCYAFAAFVALTLLPGLRLARKRRRDLASPARC